MGKLVKKSSEIHLNTLTSPMDTAGISEVENDNVSYTQPSDMNMMSVMGFSTNNLEHQTSFYNRIYQMKGNELENQQSIIQIVANGMEEVRFTKVLKKKRLRQRRLRRFLWMLTIIQILVVISIDLTFYYAFQFGLSVSIFILMINFCITMIYLNIHKAIVRPKDDPGMMIWWWCCLRIGRTGKYAKKKKQKNQEKRIAKIKTQSVVPLSVKIEEFSRRKTPGHITSTSDPIADFSRSASRPHPATKPQSMAFDIGSDRSTSNILTSSQMSN